MKRLSLTFTIFLLLTFVVSGQTFDVRQTRWDMTMDEVVKSEGMEPSRTEKGYEHDLILVYDIYLESRLVNCSYHFLNGRLYKVTYRYHWGDWQRDQSKTFSNRYSSIYTLWKSLEKKKYQMTRSWHFLNQFMSPQKDMLIACLQSELQTPFRNLDKVEQCFNSVVDVSKGPPMYAMIDFENARTEINCKFPLKNHDYKDSFIAWVTFTSKSNGERSDF